MKFVTQIPNDDKTLFQNPLKVKVDSSYITWKRLQTNVDIRYIHVIKDTIFFISLLKLATS